MIHKRTHVVLRSGVTTNPNLITRTRRAGLDVLKDILRLTQGPVFYQVTAETVEGRAEQARQASQSSPDRVLVKTTASTGNFTLASQSQQAIDEFSPVIRVTVRVSP